MSNDDNKKICKTTAKEAYFLTDKELSLLDSIGVQKRHSYIHYVLYDKNEVIQAFCDKYKVHECDIEEQQEKLKLEKEVKKANRQAKRKETKSKRKKELIKALEEKGLELRSDSKLCQMYIDGSKWTLAQVVQRMCQMKYLYDYCDMDAYYEEARESQYEEREAGYYPDMSIMEEAEDRALRKHGFYPQEWPWLKK